MGGDGINLFNLYTLFWIFAVMLAFALLGAVFENMGRIRLALKRFARKWARVPARSGWKKRRRRKTQALWHHGVFASVSKRLET